MNEATQLRPEGRERRMRSFGRLAAFAYLVAGVIAIPANLLIAPGSSVIYWMPLVGLLLGVLWLLLPWGRLPEWMLHLPFALGTVAIAAAATFSNLEFTTYYVFVAVSVAIVFARPRPIAAHLGLICVALAFPVFLGGRTGDPALLTAVLTAPSLVVISAVIGTLVARLEDARSQYRAQALTDELTGVGNYRALHQALDREVAIHRRSGRTFAVIVIDLNGFKQVNEYFGHLEGDRVLAGVGARLSGAVRGGDLTFRQGGDEFSVLAPETSPEQADQLCARMQRELAGAGTALTPVSASCGTAVFPGDGIDTDQLLRAADANLMAGKHKRNRRTERSLA